MVKKISEKLPRQEFIESFGRIPRLAITLLIINTDGEFLMARRKIDPEIGKWHLPGSFLLKGETIAKCRERIFENELGLKLKTKAKLVTNSEDLDKDSRGHVIDAVYEIRLDLNISLLKTNETSKAWFFSRIPKNTGFNHGELLKKLGYEIEK